jgi:hypothetical protein
MRSPLVPCACSSGSGNNSGARKDDWPMLAGGLARTGFNQNETAITAANVSQLAVKWKFATAAPAAASPVVATVDLPDEETCAS